MNAVLITTTIYVPSVLRLYRRLGPDVPFIVIGDRKTPEDEVRSFLAELGNATFLGVEDQIGLDYACSEAIGWNTIMRRNIGILEAAKRNPDIIITIDDDNIPVDRAYFSDFADIFASDFAGLCADQPSGWFNAAAFLEPPTYHRGFPYSQRSTADAEVTLKGVTDQRVGVAAGLWAGDPDIDAMTRIALPTQVRTWSRSIDGGLVVSPDNYGPYNTQNTAIRAELAALLHVWVDVGRYDDIWASYVAERIMRDLGYVVHFGKPLVWQQRNVQNLWKNLGDEMLGMQSTDAFIDCLEGLVFASTDVLDRLRQVYEAVAKLTFMPERTVRAGLAFCDDYERVARAA